MFDDSINNQQLLPTYPASIKGELRIILQVKDQFLLCFKHLEILTTLWEHQNRIITKEFILEQIKSGDSEIEQLNLELQFEKDMIALKEQHNDALILELQTRGEHLIADSSKRRIKSCKLALFRACHKDINEFLHSKDSAFVAILQNIGERIDTAQEELKLKLRPLLEFYKDLFYLQLHFTLALTQISCFCMPLMTDSIGLMDRLFFWTERPEFELIKRSGQICDRLRDIYTRLQRILGRLYDSVIFLQDQIELQRILEIKFYEKMKQIGEEKDDILEHINSIHINTDLLEEENDRLVGTLVKMDPFFTNSEAFKFYADHRNATSVDDSFNTFLSTRSKSKNKKSSLATKISNKKVNKNSDTGNSKYSFISQNTNNENMSNVKKKISLNREKLDNLVKWKNELKQMLVPSKKRENGGESIVQSFSDINLEPDKGYIFSVPLSRRSEKYKIYSPENLNQTTDAFVLTSEILPKDD